MVLVFIYVNMGENIEPVKGTANSHKTRQVFYSSGVDKLARFVDDHPREIRVSLSYYNLRVVNFYMWFAVLSLTVRRSGLIT